jgi:tagaturonate reductase
MPVLNKDNLTSINAENLVKPNQGMLGLPEKVLQFGTGALLRGLPDFFIDEANRSQLFNGRIVMVKSTDQAGADYFAGQNGLYSLCIRGLENGQSVERTIINGSISRVIDANSQWQQVLQVACEAAIELIISNTTEVGIQYLPESIFDGVPQQFPAKLLACLHARYQYFEDKPAAGLVILPTELISDNATQLLKILVQLAEFNSLDENFIDWLSAANTFCNTLVDCIVPGYPDLAFRNKFESAFGYTDQLMIMSEVYRLWAIEGPPELLSKLSFATMQNGVVITNDIRQFKELKLRLLNGTHTLSCGLAFLRGFTTVKEAMDNPAMASFIKNTMLQEIAPAIPYAIAPEDAEKFALQVIDRFSNPGIAHAWLSITLQYSMKMRERCIPVLMKYYRQFNAIPPNFALGFAAYLLFSKGVKKQNDQYFGNHNGHEYPIKDDRAAYFYELWSSNDAETLVLLVLENKQLWGIDLSEIKGFEAEVLRNLQQLIGN